MISDKICIQSFKSSPIKTIVNQKYDNKNVVIEDEKPPFHYDLELFNLCKEFLDSKNHHGLALLARQKGIPPFLRFKVWPILLKYHPYVLNPSIQPDSELINNIIDNTTSNENEFTTIENLNGNIKISLNENFNTKQNHDESNNSKTDVQTKTDKLKIKIKKDLKKYIQRLKYCSFVDLSSLNISNIESQIFEILENSILKFSLKWKELIKYDQSLTWIALNLAEWFPPIVNTPWVFFGRDITNNNSFITSIYNDYSNYIDNIPNLYQYLNDLLNDDEKKSMSFHDVYERLVLVLLHSPPEEKKNNLNEHKKYENIFNYPFESNLSEIQPLFSSTNSALFFKFFNDDQNTKPSKNNKLKKLDKNIFPINGGTIEERVLFFIYCFKKLLPELSVLFHEEQILNKFGSYDDQWLIWWLKFCGSKVWSKYDRGRIWDLLLGWRLKNPKKKLSYYHDKLKISSSFCNKLGPDVFWSMNINDVKNKTEMNNDNIVDIKENTQNLPLIENFNETFFNKTTSLIDDDSNFIDIPFSKIDAHIEIIFISLALLKSKEQVLVELDQHEIRQYLSRLPTKSYKYKLKKFSNFGATEKSLIKKTSVSLNQSNSTKSMKFLLENSFTSIQKDSNLQDVNLSNQQPYNLIISNDSLNNYKVDFIDNIINEAGELWRKFLWMEIIDDN